MVSVGHRLVLDHLDVPTSVQLEAVELHFRISRRWFAIEMREATALPRRRSDTAGHHPLLASADLGLATTEMEHHPTFMRTVVQGDLFRESVGDQVRPAQVAFRFHPQDQRKVSKRVFQFSLLFLPDYPSGARHTDF